MSNTYCALSLWRVVRGSKLMHLDSLIHGLFITKTQFRLLSTFDNNIIHIYTAYNIYGAISLLFISPCRFPFVPFFVPFTYLETLLAVTGPAHLGLRLLVNWPPPPQPFPILSPLQIPSTQVKYAPHYDDFKNPASLVRNTNEHCALLTVPFIWVHIILSSVFWGSHPVYWTAG